MAVSFRIQQHSIRDVEIVEILVNGVVAGVIYPTGPKRISLVSAHIESSQTDADFAGDIIEDDGSHSMPPIPALHVQLDSG